MLQIGNFGVILNKVNRVILREWAQVHSFILEEVNVLSKRDLYESKTEELVMPLIQQNQFELVDVEYVKEGSNWYLRVYIDKPGGINVDDCERISRALSDLLDEKDYIEDAYILEVSSPGLGRPLKKEKDFERSIGKDVDIRLYRAKNGCKEFTGALISYDKDTVTVNEAGEELTFDRNEIALIRLAFDF